MARLRGGRGGRGGLLRTVERLGVSRGVFGGSKGWFYVGTGLWTLRKVRSLGERKTEILMREPLAPGDRLVIANGVATIESGQTRAATASEQRSRRGRRKQRRAQRRALVTQADLRKRRRSGRRSR